MTRVLGFPLFPLDCCDFSKLSADSLILSIMTAVPFADTIITFPLDKVLSKSNPIMTLMPTVVAAIPIFF